MGILTNGTFKEIYYIFFFFFLTTFHTNPPFESDSSPVWKPVCVSVRLPKAIHVSRKARGEITLALSLLSGPHPSVIVQVILWKQNGSVGRLKGWLMRPLRRLSPQKWRKGESVSENVCHRRWYHQALVTSFAGPQNLILRTFYCIKVIGLYLKMCNEKN